MNKKIRKSAERSCRVSYPVRRKHPLYTQYRAQRASLAFTNQDIADEARVARTTVARELGIEPPKPMSLTLAQRLGHILGFDAGYVALVHARDTIWAQIHSDRYGEDVRQKLKDILAQLDSYVRKQHPFRIADMGRRLAFRAMRCRRQLSAERLAHHARCSDPVSPLLIHRYEAGVSSISQDGLDTLLDGFTLSSPHVESVTASALDHESRRMTIAHTISDTLEWHSYKGTTLYGHHLYCPCELGYDIAIGLSPTLWRAMEVKLIKVTQPRKGPRVRIIGLQPKGLQLGVLAQGRARLTLRSTPFPAEEIGRCYHYTPDQPGIDYARTCEAGEVIVAPGQRFYRLEFLSGSCLLAIIGLSGNLFLDEPM